jgi:L-iditol 2-dehydrogenase
MTTINANIVHYNYIKVVGTSRQSIRQYLKTLSLIEAGKIDLGPLVTGSYTLDHAAEAFGAAQRAEGLKHMFAIP